MADDNDGGVDIPITVGLENAAALDDLRSKLGNLGENIDRLTSAMGQNATASNATAATFNRLAKEQDTSAAAGARFLAGLKLQAETLGLTGAALAAAKAGYYNLGDEAQAAVGKMAAFEASIAIQRAEAAEYGAELKALSVQLKALAEIEATDAQARFNSALGVKQPGSGSGDARASAAVFQEAIAEQEQYAAQVSALKDKIDPAAMAQRRLGEQTAFANKALADGLITETEHASALKIAQKEADNLASRNGPPWRIDLGRHPRNHGFAARTVARQFLACSWLADHPDRQVRLDGPADEPDYAGRHRCDRSHRGVGL